jgi:3-hydroxybutyryl-CoA dehydrogenase
MEIRRIFVVGAGTMGNGIAQVASTAGYQVTLMDVLPEQLQRAQTVIAKSTEKLLGKGAITEVQRVAALNIPTTSGLKGIATADLVIEAASENPELKFNIFRDLDHLTRPEAILASNTSSIITKIAAATNIERVSVCIS